MAIEVKKISDLPEATSVQGDELLEMVQDGRNVKIPADELIIKKDELLASLDNKVDKIPGKQLSDQNFTQAEKNKLSNLIYMLDDKVDRELGKGLIEPAPYDDKQYARKNDEWVEVSGAGGGLRTFLAGTTLFMTSDGSSPAPAPKPISSTFSYKFEVGHDTETGADYYGAAEGSPYWDYGTFIENVENDEIGKLLSVEWSYVPDYGYSIFSAMEGSDYLLTYYNNIELIFKDLNGTVLSITVPFEDIYEGSVNDSSYVMFDTKLTKEQFNSLPTSGIVSVDIVLETVPNDNLFRYEFEIGVTPFGSYGVAEMDFSEPNGTFIENIENDRIGKLVAAEWARNEIGYSINVGSVSSDYLLSYNSNLELIVCDHNGEIVRVTVTPDAIFELSIPEYSDLQPPLVLMEAYLTEEQYNLLPKNGRVFLYIALDAEAEKTSFRYVVDIGQSVGSDGGWATYGADSHGMGSFIENKENDKLGIVSKITWSFSLGTYSGDVYTLNINLGTSSTLHTHDKDIEIKISGENGEFIRLIVPPEDIRLSDFGWPFIEHHITPEQLNLFPTSGIAVIDIDLDPPIIDVFSYEIEVGQSNDPNGEYEFYGVINELGAFIENDANDMLGELTSFTWRFDRGGRWRGFIRIAAEDTNYFYFNDTIIKAVIKDQNGEIAVFSATSENVWKQANDIVYIEFTDLTEEQFNLIPKSGRVFVDLVVETIPKPEPDFSCTFEIGESIDHADWDTLHGVSESDFSGTFGTFIEKTESDKLGNVTSVVWSSEHYGNYIYIITENSDYLLLNDTNIEIFVRDQDGNILREHLSPEAVEELPSGEVKIRTHLWHEKYDLLPKSGTVSVDVYLTPFKGGIIS